MGDVQLDISSNVKKANWTKRTFLAVFIVSFVNIVNLFVVGGLVNLAACAIGFWMGNITFNALNKIPKDNRIKNLAIAIFAAIIFFLGLSSLVLSQQMKKMSSVSEHISGTIDEKINFDAGEVTISRGALVQTLLMACKEGGISEAKKILKQGVEINDKLLGVSCLYTASLFGQVEVVEWALEQGAKIDDINGPMQITALHIASREGHVDVIRALLRWGANPAAVNHRGRTAEYFARELPAENYQEIKQLLTGPRVEK